MLGQAEVVLYDALAHPSLLEACPRAEQRDVGKRYNEPSPSQDDINRELVALAREGKRVVRLKGGDPLLFARGAEEAEALAAAGVPFEIVPGIPSPIAAAAYAGISLTHRDLSSSVTFITGSDKAGEDWSPAAWSKLATATDTICVLMGMRRLEDIAQAIIDGGRARDTPAAVIQWGARPEQRVVVATLDTLGSRVREAGLTNPAVIVVGEVVGLRDSLRWYDSRPLFGKRVLVPRAPHQAGTTASALRERAASPLLVPVIDVVDPPEPERLAEAATKLKEYRWVVFTSANGVQRFLTVLAQQGLDSRAFGGLRLGVIGPKTAEELSRHGLRADCIAKEFVGESLAEALIAASPERGSVLMPRALVAREELPRRLREAGFSVDVVPAYRTVPVSEERTSELRSLLDSGGIDAVLFTSASTVHALCDLLGAEAEERLSRITVASIGPVTSHAAEERGLRPSVTATEYTVAGLLDALEGHFAAHPTA